MTNIPYEMPEKKNMADSSEKKQKKNSSPLASLLNKSRGDQSSTEYKEGDIIAFYRKVQRITHYGIYMGGEVIIHVTGEEKIDAEVKMEALHLVKKGDKSWVANDDEKLGKPADPSDIVKRAFDKRGKFEYHLINNNCEHFATFCRYGKPYSSQTDLLQKILSWKMFNDIYNKLKTETLENFLEFEKFVHICRKGMKRGENEPPIGSEDASISSIIEGENDPPNGSEDHYISLNLETEKGREQLYRATVYAIGENEPPSGSGDATINAACTFTMWRLLVNNMFLSSLSHGEFSKSSFFFQIPYPNLHHPIALASDLHYTSHRLHLSSSFHLYKTAKFL
ncbi:hypothetical protein Btru_058449 [Bulinus truncatus]|nr:hypothetical protein Btru_058449 [Bulinus truncatus]